MPNSSQFSNYHPAWDGHNFSQDEYEKVLKKLANKKGDEVLMVDDNSVKTAGKLMQLWQRVKGWCGFENQTDITKVNYELLKLLRYGENCHYFDEKSIQELLDDVRAKLDRQNNSIVLNAIGDILSTGSKQAVVSNIDKKITSFYKLHQDELHEAYWGQFFNDTMTPFHGDRATYQFNTGRISNAEGDYPTGIRAMEDAIAVCPTRDDWKWELVQAKVAYGQNLLVQGDNKGAWEVFREISNELKSPPIQFESDYEDLTRQLFLPMLGLGIHSGAVDWAVQHIGSRDAENIMKDYEAYILQSPSLKPRPADLNAFYLAMGEKTKKAAYIEKSVNIMLHALEEQPWDGLHNDLVKGYLLLARTQANGHIVLSDAGKHIALHRKDISSETMKNYEMAAKSAVQSLLSNRTAETLPAALSLLYHLKDLASSSPEKSNYALQIADLHEAKQKPHDAWQEIAEAHLLNPTKPITDRLVNLSRSLAATEKEQGRYKKAAEYLEHVINMNPADKQTSAALLELYGRMDKWPKAYEIVKKQVSENAHDMELLLTASTIAEKCEDRANAIAYAEKALALSRYEPKAILRVFELTNRIDNTFIDQAISSLIEENKKDPNNWKIHKQLGELYTAANRNDDARRHLEFAAQQVRNIPSSKNADIFATLANFEFKDNHPEKALQYYKEAAAIARSTNSYIEEQYMCQLAIGDAARDKGDAAKMFQSYDAAATLAPTERHTVGLKYLDAGEEAFKLNHEAKQKAFVAALEIVRPKSIPPARLANVHAFLGDQDKSKGLVQKAIPHYELARELEPSNTAVGNKLAECYRALGQSDKAEAILRELVGSEMGSHNATSLISLGDIELKKKEYENAIEFYQKAAKSNTDTIGLRPKLYECYFNLALNDTEMRPEQALMRFREAMTVANQQQKVDVCKILLTLGNTYLRSNRQESAVECCQIVINSDVDTTKLPQHLLADAYVCLGRIGNSKDNSERAGFYEKAVALSPKDAKILIELGDIYTSMGQAEKADACYRKAIALDPSNAALKDKIIKSDLAVAENYYSRGVHDPANTAVEINNTVDRILRSPYGENILNSLNNWRAIFGDNQDVQDLRMAARRATTPEAIEYAGNRVIELLEKAYDGQPNHMLWNNCPPDIRREIENIRNKLGEMRGYYEMVQSDTEKTVAALRKMGFESVFSMWKPIPSISNLKNVSEVIDQANNVVRTAETYAQTNRDISRNLDATNQINALKNSLSNNVWFHKAIDNYIKVVEQKPHFGLFCNRMIDAYVQIGDYLGALNAYEQLRSQYPESAGALQINPRVFSEIAKTNLKSQMRPENLFMGLVEAGKAFVRTNDIPSAIDTYRQAILIDHPNRMQEVVIPLMNIMDAMLAKGEHALALDAYDVVADYLPRIPNSFLPNDRKMAIYYNLGGAATRIQNWPKAVTLYQLALGFNKNEPGVNAALAGAYEMLNNLDKAIEHHGIAAQMIPAQFNPKLRQTQLLRANQLYSVVSMAGLDTEINDFVTYVCSGTPDAEKIKATLSSSLGEWYSDYGTLKGLATAKRTNYADIKSAADQAVKLLSKAYNGRIEDMEPELRRRFNELRTLITETDVNTQNILAPNYQFDLSEQAVKTMGNRALDLYNAAIAIDRVYGDHYNKLIDTYVQTGRYAEALQVYERYKTLSQNIKINPRVYEMAAKIGKKGGLSNAEVIAGLLKEAAEQNKAGNVVGALDSYQRALKLSGTGNVENIINTILEMGNNFKANRDDENALRTYELVLPYVEKVNMMPNQKIEIYKTVANAAAQSGNLEKALVNYQKILAINPRAEIYQSAVGDIYAQQGNYEKAIEHYRNTANTDKLRDALINLADIRFAKYNATRANNGINDLLNYVLVSTSPVLRQDIEKVLGSGFFSNDFTTLKQQMNVSNDSFASITNRAEKVIALLNKAFDKIPFPMPVELKKRMEILQSEIANSEKALGNDFDRNKKLPLSEYRDLQVSSMNLYKEAFDLDKNMEPQQMVHVFAACLVNNSLDNAIEIFNRMGVVMDLELPMQSVFDNIDALFNVNPEIAKNLVHRLSSNGTNATLKNRLKSHLDVLTAKNFISNKDKASAIRSLHNAQGYHVEAEPSCYQVLSLIYKTAFDKSTAIISGDDFLHYPKKIVEYRKQVVQYDSYNPKFQSDVGDAIKDSAGEVSEDPSQYYKRAAELEPNSKQYGIKIVQGMSYAKIFLNKYTEEEINEAKRKYS